MIAAAISGDLRRIVVLVRRPSNLDDRAFGEHLLRIGRALAARDGAQTVAIYAPDTTVASNRHRLPRATSFDAMLELAAPDADRALAAVAIGPHAAYRVEQRRLKTRPQKSAIGQPTAGVILVSPVCRAPSLSHAAFDAYWRDRHGPLALAHHVGMCDYKQDVVVERLTEDAPPFDGIARLGFATLADYETVLFASKESGRAIAEDTAAFVDVARLEVALLRETVLA